MRIAQRFNAGIEVGLYQVPKGRQNPRSVGRPFGTYAFGRPYPALKRWAILRRPSGQQLGSLKILAALGVSPAVSCGVLPGESGISGTTCLDIGSAGPGGRMPPSNGRRGRPPLRNGSV